MWARHNLVRWREWSPRVWRGAFLQPAAHCWKLKHHWNLQHHWGRELTGDSLGAIRGTLYRLGLTRRTHSHTPDTSRLKETCLPAPPALPWRRHRRQIHRQVPRHRSRHREPTPPRRGWRAARHPAPPREAGPKVSPKVHTKAPPRQAPPRRRAAVRTRPVHC